jgi:DNA adenine methylase
LSLDEFNLDHINAPKRVMAPVQWFGGKGNFAKNILPYLPKSTVYVEPFMGAASVFWHLSKPYPVEVLNDLDGELVNLFRVLQDDDLFADFERKVIWTPYARAEFGRALDMPKDASQVDRAWAFFVGKNQGFSGKGDSLGDWGRAFVSQGGCANTTNKWRKRMKCLEMWHDRLTRVQIDNQDALTVIRYWDSADTTFYCDPPYVPDTRVAGSRDVYAHEPTEAFHAELVETLLGCKGNVVLSGYGHEVYEPLTFAGWKKVDFETACHAAGKGRGSKMRGEGSLLKHASRTECLWVNPKAYEKTRQNLAFDF